MPLARPALAAALALAAAIPAVAGAQTIASPEPATITLVASGEVRSAPDEASMQVGVSATAPTAQAAAQDEAQRMTRLVAALKGAGVEGKDLQTSRITLNPQYVYAQNQPPRLTGYTATNGVTVRVHDLARVGALIDAATAAGADNVGGISFDLSTADKAADEARVRAVRTLSGRAQLYADAAGQRVLRLKSLSETSVSEPSGPRPLVFKAMARSAAPETPVEAGEVSVRVEVTAVYEVAPK